MSYAIRMTGIMAAGAVLVAGAAPVLAHESNLFLPGPGKQTIHKVVAVETDHAGAELTVTLGKGRKRSVLEIKITASTAQLALAATSHASMRVTVNGHPTTSPNLTGAACRPQEGNFGDTCNLSGVFYLDIDAAEATHPGEFSGQPLQVAVSFDEISFSSGDNMRALLSARLQRK